MVRLGDWETGWRIRGGRPMAGDAAWRGERKRAGMFVWVLFLLGDIAASRCCRACGGRRGAGVVR